MEFRNQYKVETPDVAFYLMRLRFRKRSVLTDVCIADNEIC